MKEATGELNATVVVLVVVGFLMAFFYFTLWPLIKDSINKSTQCSKAICDNTNVVDGMVTCWQKGHYKDSKYEMHCAFKG